MLSSAGRASPLHGGGRGFEPLSIHHLRNTYGGVAKRLNAADCKSAPSGSAVRICPPPPCLGCSQAVRQQTLTLSSRWFDPTHPSQHLPLAQSVEHLTFNQGVRSSNLLRETILMNARVAEQVDAQDLKSCGSDTIPVRFRSRAPTSMKIPPFIGPKIGTINRGFYY